ncbi:hypothetical protein HPP92_024320, partial [Vanilla planifolia]
MGGKPSEVVQLRAVRSLGLGFDLASDFRLKFAKGYPNRRLVLLDEENTADLVFPGGLTIKGVSTDISCDKGDRIQFCSDVLEFNQMSELFNQKSLILGNVPSGYFNALFNLSGAWFEDAKETKYLAFNGYFISLYNLHLRASPLVLCDEVKGAVPSSWEPAALSRFIRTYGTHVIVEIGLGGQDVICIRQNNSSNISITELKLRLEDVGELMFSDGLTIICSKRGGDQNLHSHSKWLQTLPNYPDAIFFKFVPITSLLTGIPGSGYLSLAIDLYLRCFEPSQTSGWPEVVPGGFQMQPVGHTHTASFDSPGLVCIRRFLLVLPMAIVGRLRPGIHRTRSVEEILPRLHRHCEAQSQVVRSGFRRCVCGHRRPDFDEGDMVEEMPPPPASLHHVPNCTVQKTEWDRQQTAMAMPASCRASARRGARILLTRASSDSPKAGTRGPLAGGVEEAPEVCGRGGGGAGSKQGAGSLACRCGRAGEGGWEDWLA